MEKQEFTEGQVHEAMVRLRGAGLTPADFQRLVENKQLAEKVVAVIKHEQGQKQYVETLEAKITNIETRDIRATGISETEVAIGIDHPVVKEIFVVGATPSLCKGDKIRVFIDLTEKRGWFKKQTTKRALRCRETFIKKIELLDERNEVVWTYTAYRF